MPIIVFREALKNPIHSHTYTNYYINMSRHINFPIKARRASHCVIANFMLWQIFLPYEHAHISYFRVI